jgi:hypothetical protein
MTLDEVSEQCGVPLETLLEGLGLPGNTSPHTALRDLVSQVDGFEVQQVRDVVTSLQAQ